MGHMVAERSLLDTVAAKAVLQTAGVAPLSQLSSRTSGTQSASRCSSVTLETDELCVFPLFDGKK